MLTRNIYTLAELAEKHDMLKSTLLKRVHSRQIPFEKFGNTMAIQKENIDRLLSKKFDNVELATSHWLYIRWARFRRMGGMHKPWANDFFVFVEDVMKLPNADQTMSLVRIDSRKKAVKNNLHWC